MHLKTNVIEISLAWSFSLYGSKLEDGSKKLLPLISTLDLWLTLGGHSG